MKRVAEAVVQLIQNDQTALESFKEGLLNLSAYAEKIHPFVEKLTYKPVKKGTIVVALSRLSNSSLKGASKPKVQISHLSTRSPLTAFTYQKTADTQRRVSTLNPYILTPADLFGMIDGESEIVLIASEKAVELINDHVGVIPKSENPNLVAITVQFPEELKDTHSFLNTLLSALASNKINITYLLPTRSEISFIMDAGYTEQAISILNLYAVKKEKNE